MQQKWTARKVLVVDPAGTLATDVEAACSRQVRIVGCPDFVSARRALLRDEPALLITDLRLGAYNGLHLAYLAGTAGMGTCTIVFADPMDLTLAHEAQRIGAFVEWRHRIPFVVDAYIAARLPPVDRRAITSFDRRREFRGGRRASDVAAAFQGSASTAGVRRSAR